MDLAHPLPGSAAGARRRAGTAPLARCAAIVAVLVAALFPLAPAVAAAATTTATGGSAIAADTAAAGGTGAWTTLTGPVIAESSAGQVGAGTIVLTAPVGFEWNPASGGVATSGGACAGLTLSALAITPTTATTAASGASTGACTLTWTGLGVRPLAGAPRVSGHITRGGTAAILGVAPGAVMGLLTEVPGAATTLAFTTSPTGGTGGTAFVAQPAVAVEDRFGNTVTGQAAVIAVGITGGTATAGAALTCTGGLTKTATAGASAFSGCAIDLAGNGYTLTASATGLASATTPAFSVAVGTASQAVFTVPPGGGTGGTAWATQPVVRLLDAGGNPTTATTVVTLAITAGTGSAGAGLSCPGGLAKAAVAGLVTFAGCTIDRAGSGYTLKATGSGLAAATSTPFAVAVGPAAKLVLTMQPGGGVAGTAWAAQPAVAVTDAGGNPVAGATDTVTLAIGTNAGGGTLACTGGPAAAAVAGGATFAGCTIERTGAGYTLAASAPGLAGAVSTAFTVTPAAAASLLLAIQPGGGTGGVAWSVQPVVRVVDAYGNLVTGATTSVSLALVPGTGTTGATLACTGGQARAASGGIATFAGCKTDLAGAGYGLAASASGLAGVTSVPFTVAVGPAATLVFTTSPGGGTGGTGWAVQPVVEVRDAGGNLVAGASLSVTLSITSGTGASGAVLACTGGLAAAATAGVVTYTGCRIDRSAAGYTLKATGSGVGVGTSAAFAVTVGVPARLAFTATPTTIVAGSPFNSQPVVAVQDAGGNLVVSATDMVTIGIAAGTGTPGANPTCTGGLGRAAVAGLATYGGCTVDRVGTGYALAASAPGLAGATSGGFGVTAGPAAALQFTVSPNGGTGGSTWTIQPVVRIVDAWGNPATGSTTVTLGVAPGTGQAGATLSCTGGPSKVTTAGSATFAGCRIDRAAAGYQLVATGTGLAVDTSAGFDVAAGVAVSMVFSGQPGGGTAMAPWGSQPVVTILDAGGNVATGSSGQVTLAVASGQAGSLACLGGLTQAAVAGVATFNGCLLDKAGPGYTLTATSPGLTSATSATFAVVAGVPVRLGFTAQPGGGTGGSAWSTQPVVALQDAGGNTVTAGGLTVTLALTTNDAGGTFACNGGETRITASGVATFTGCAIDRVGTGYQVTASVSGGVATDALSTPFNVVTGPAARLIFETQPGGGTGGIAWVTQPVVTAADAGGNATTGTPVVTVAVEAGSGTAGAALACTTGPTRTAAAGRAAYTGCSIDRAATAYRLRATAPGLVDGLSATFDVVPGVAARLGFSVQPSGGAAGTTWATQPVVTLLDAGGNVAAGATPVTLDVVTNPGGGTLACAGGATVVPVAGVATFAGCSLDRAGSGYQVRAAASGLAAATSAAFGVVAGAPSRLAFSLVPAGGLGGSAFGVQPTVRVEDAWGNLASGSTVAITLGLAVNPSGATLACNGGTTMTSVAGLASFSGCAIDRVGTAYALGATAGGLTGTLTPSFDVTAGPPARLAFVLQPSGGSGGSAWSVQPVVAVRDAGGNPTVATVPVTLALGANPGSGTLTCATGLALVTVNGTVAFGGCAVDRAATGYVLMATAPGLAASTSAAFDVAVGTAAQLGFTVQPSGGGAGGTWSTQPVVAVQDAGGNLVAGATNQVSLAAGSAAAGALACAGGTTVVAVNGAASFSGCAWTQIGNGNTVQAIATGLAPATSTPFTVTVGTPARLRFQAAPAGATGGSAFPVQPVIQLTDAFDNPATVSSVAVTLTLEANVAGGSLSCNGGPVQATSAGLATFTGCAVDRAASGYRVVASAVGLQSAVSPPFDVMPGVAARIAFLTQPGNGMGGSPLGTQPVVALLDAGGNQATGAGSAITVALTAGSGTNGAMLLCANGNAVAPAGGLAVFAGCAVDRVGTGYTLTATRAGFPSVVSATFSVSTGPAAALVNTTQPPGGTGGVAWGAQPVVAVVDTGGNPVSSVAPVTLLLGANPAGGILACTGGQTSAAAAGSATFAGCRIDRVGAGYTLRATSPGLVAANGSSFAIAAGPAARTGFTASPGNGPADAAFAVQPRVLLYDAGGNASSSAAPVTLAIAAGTGTAGAVLSCPGGQTRSAVNGVATFDGCGIDRAGTGYRLQASGPGLAPTTSAPFDVAAPDALLSMTTSALTVTYPQSVTLRASFRKLGAARPVSFQGSVDGTTWTPLVTAVSSSDGIASYAFTPTLIRYYRAVFNGDATLGPDTSASVRVVVAGTTALAPSAGTSYRSVSRGTRVTLTATLRPWSTGRPRPLVTFTLWRLVGSAWKASASKSVRANTLGRASYRFALPAAGRWSVTARAGSTTAVGAGPTSNRALYRVH